MFLAFTLFVFSNVAVAAVTMELCVPVASTERSVMSDQSVPENTLHHRLNELRRQQDEARFLRMWNAPGVFNINALDELDPVHVRASKNPEREFDYDGDMGREHDDYLRDNGAGRTSTSIAGSFVQIADALPVIESPSIVAEQPQASDHQSGAEPAEAVSEHKRADGP
jgi:hypothetical protein